MAILTTNTNPVSGTFTGNVSNTNLGMMTGAYQAEAESLSVSGTPRYRIEMFEARNGGWIIIAKDGYYFAKDHEAIADVMKLVVAKTKLTK